MQTRTKPTLALISNFAERSCGFAAYTRLREASFAPHFDVQVFDLRSGDLMRVPDRADAADSYIDEICNEIRRFDIVCLDAEVGIWGDTLEKCEERMRKCCDAARRLIVTIHRVDVGKDGNFDFALAQARLLNQLANRSADKPFYLLTHAEPERDILQTAYGFDHVVSHPLCYITSADKIFHTQNSDPQKWKEHLGYSQDSILVGVFGALSKYKDNETVIRALKYLPEKYKLVIVGGAHPFSIRPFETDQNISGLLRAINEISDEQPGFAERVRFCGIQEDAEFKQSMFDCDLVVVPYHDAGQLASGVGSMAFEFGKNVIATHTQLFLGYRKLYGDSFELYDIGNYIELRDRIARFDIARQARMQLSKNNYTPETMAELVDRISRDMMGDGFETTVDKSRVRDFITTLQRSRDDASAPREHTSSAESQGELEHLRKAFSEALYVQEQLKAEKAALELRVPASSLLRRISSRIGQVARHRISTLQIKKALSKSTPVRRFNTILDDDARSQYDVAIGALWLAEPDMMKRKIVRANVQQGFMLAAVNELAARIKSPSLLCVGSFEDTACVALQKMGYEVVAIDPAINYDLRTYRAEHSNLKDRFDIIFSTSVIEHVEDDEGFVIDIVNLLKPGGFAVLTCDFNDEWRPEDPKPSTDFRLYTKNDMERLVSTMKCVKLIDTPDWDRSYLDFTIQEGPIEHRYTFATLVVQKIVGLN